ncbi:MAG: glycosyl transferase family protein [Acidobacteriia bacterium]|nr:glycosyl transferase family protein [Terriglobia bacterium]
MVYSGVDHLVLAILAPLAAAILISGLDDLVVDLAWAWTWLKSALRPAASLFPPGLRQLENAPRQRIAIFVPLWHEHQVIGRMLEHNLAAIRYPDYHFFAGCYPNDVETQEAVRSVADRFPQVHLALCPHPGPTSKADCLNWIYQHLLLHEENSGQIFDIVMLHDAEDLIHPEELRWINYYAARYDFVQTPVLALATPLRKLTHGVYCDEFAENHSRDMTVRAVLGGFVPSCGVGTGYRRDALERLARASSNRLFEPEALTEDYENGLRLFRLGCSQAFVPISKSLKGGRDFVVTREFFPASWNSALRQRTRWVTGIALQGWQRFGWSGKPGELYWLWRDRKGLIANPLSVIANLVFAYGLATALWMRVSPGQARLAAATLSLQIVRIGVRMLCTGRIYGFVFALGVPVRAVYANALNTAATVQAVARYTWARIHGKPLKWLKTEHAYPARAALLAQKRKLGEILVSSGSVPAAELAVALAERTPAMRLGEYLVRSRKLEMEALYRALSFQQGLPLAQIEPETVPWPVAHALPEHAIRQWQVLPFRIAEQNLFVASPEAPGPETAQALRAFTSLEIRFHLVTPAEFERLSNALL